MRRPVMYAVLALVVVLLQVMLADRLPLPGGVDPDVVLVVVVAIGLTRGPMNGTITGFCAGLELDLVPPGGHVIGESALIFCVVGYACGRLGSWLERPAFRLLAALLAVGAGEILQAAAGLIARDPGVTLAAVRQVLPVAILYDAAICPLVLFIAALAGKRPAARQLSPRRVPPVTARRVPPVTARRVRPVTARRVRPVTARRVRLAQPAGISAVSGSELATRWLRSDGGLVPDDLGSVRTNVGSVRARSYPDRASTVGRSGAIRAIGSEGVLRRRVRVCRQVPRWSRGRSGDNDRTTLIGRTL